MLFYKVDGALRHNDDTQVEKISERDFKKAVAMKSENFNQNYDGECCCFIFEFNDARETMSIGVITKSKVEIEKIVSNYLECIDCELNITSIKETTIAKITRYISKAYRCDFINDDEEISEKYSLDALESRRFGFEYGENMVEDVSEENVLTAAKKYLMCETLLPELERIYQSKPARKIQGHPVHYVFQTDDNDIRRETYRLLLNALYTQNRIKSKRYTYIDIKAGNGFSLTAFEALYKITCQGAVIVRYITNDNADEGSYASGERDTIERMCSIIRRYQNQTLTVICLPRECKKSKAVFYENLGSMTFVEISEDFVKNQRAREFLTQMAKETGVRADKNLFAKIEKDMGYLAPQLRRIFDDWYNEKLKTTIYPQYKKLKKVEVGTQKAAPKGSAYEELQGMIGLTEAKEVIQKALNYYKVQKLYEERGIKNDVPVMHMVFSGNPGTAKTTVARLFARIMKDNNLISRGQLVEVGRGDLVGKYVGWTAQTVQTKFKEAIGGVLFIDEAYSLVDDIDGSFGDEAINTIVQEMENHREDVVVIFAGYPDKMEEFLQKNPGLRSRIAFHVPFSDYSAQELCEIASLIGKNKGIHFDDEAMEKLEKAFESARKQSDFGNGRYVRNMLEQAKMNQASRLLAYDFDDITVKEITTIKADDIVIPETKTTEKRRIGFVS